MYVWHDDGTSAPRKRDFENDITSFKDLPRCCSLPHALLLLQHHIKQVRIGMWHSPFCQLSSSGSLIKRPEKPQIILVYLGINIHRAVQTLPRSFFLHRFDEM